MLNIDKTKYVGKGNQREVYVHPKDPKLCIKIIFDSNYNKRQACREANYYRHLKQRNISWKLLPKYYGDVETNLGTGSVFDLISDHDGNVSKTLEYYFSSEKRTEEHFEGICRALNLLKEYLIENRIITMTPKSKNIVYQQNNPATSHALIIDNIGNMDFIPYCNYIAPLAKMKIERKWKRFVSKLGVVYSDNRSLGQMLDKL